MRIEAAHRTTFLYGQPVYLEPHIIRLRPRDDGSQRVVRHTLAIEPAPAGQSAYTDHNGNSVVHVWFTAAVHELTVESVFAVETMRENPFDFLLPAPEQMSLPLRLAENLRPPLEACLRPSGDVGEFAAEIMEASGRQAMPFLDRLNGALFERTNHVVRREGAPRGAEETLASREGSCRDLAVLFCAAARAAGIPARFVSGYETAAASEEHAYMHAWAEVYVPGGGWRGYDPARGVATATAHVAVAAAAEAADAAPISGTYRGGVPSRMEFRIGMKVRE
jgi:transglutaminase-like putative cysteine protease